MKQDDTPDETTTPTASTDGSTAATLDTTADPIDSLPDPDLNDEGSEAYAKAMGDFPEEPVAETPPADPETAASTEQQAEPEQVLWRREGSRFVKYEPPTVVPPKIEPWKANIYGQEVEAIPGVLKNEAGDLFIPAAHVGTLNQKLAHATKYPEVQQARQERAAERKQAGERMEFVGQKFAAILDETLLNPEWMTWATTSKENFETAKMQVSLKLQQGDHEATTKFGALPKTTDAPDQSDALDPYEAEGAVDEFLTELLTSPDYHGKLSPQDTAAVKAQLKREKVQVFTRHPEQGWLLDERPFRAAMALRLDSKTSTTAASVTRRTEVPKAEVAGRRNAAAVPKTTESAPLAKQAAPPTPKDKYADHPWDNPELSFHERRKLFNKAKGFSAVSD